MKLGVKVRERERGSGGGGGGRGMREKQKQEKHDGVIGERIVHKLYTFFLQGRFRLGGQGASSTSGAGVFLPGLGTLGRGHVKSLSSSGQKGRICSYRYH